MPKTSKKDVQMAALEVLQTIMGGAAMKKKKAKTANEHAPKTASKKKAKADDEHAPKKAMPMKAMKKKEAQADDEHELPLHLPDDEHELLLHQKRQIFFKERRNKLARERYAAFKKTHAKTHADDEHAADHEHAREVRRRLLTPAQARAEGLDV